jgi:hypothetical protein
LVHQVPDACPEPGARHPGASLRLWDTPNIRVITLRDFRTFCAGRGIRILREIDISTHHRDESGKIVRIFPDWFARYGIFLIAKQGSTKV